LQCSCLRSKVPLEESAHQHGRDGSWMGPCSSPPSSLKDDLFTIVANSLRSAGTMDMLNLARATLRDMAHIVGDK
jgi:hypothetical protein